MEGASASTPVELEETARKGLRAAFDIEPRANDIDRMVLELFFRPNPLLAEFVGFNRDQHRKHEGYRHNIEKASAAFATFEKRVPSLALDASDHVFRSSFGEISSMLLAAMRKRGFLTTVKTHRDCESVLEDQGFHQAEESARPPRSSSFRCSLAARQRSRWPCFQRWHLTSSEIAATHRAAKRNGATVPATPATPNATSASTRHPAASAFEYGTLTPARVP